MTLKRNKHTELSVFPRQIIAGFFIKTEVDTGMLREPHKPWGEEMRKNMK